MIFGRYRLDPVSGRLWRGKKALFLKPKAFAVLRYLVEHPGRLVSKEELLDALWPGVAVSDAVLKVCIGELRQALRDEAKAPQFIETVHRRGYRFISQISTQPSAVSRQLLETRNLQLETRLVGREAELGQLQEWLERALRGERQIIFVTGEAGIGKTSLVEALVERAGASGELWIGRGQCIEHYGAGEAYLPVLEALGRLCRESAGERLIELLGQHAPTWLAQMPSLLSAAELESVQRKALGATRERMLREMAEALEVLTAERALALWLEDLHWSDYSTLELLSSLARRRERARLLVVGTYRPVEVIMRGHPLKGVKQELQAHGQCEEMVLGYLSEEAVEKYLEWRFARGRVAAGLAGVVHQRTEGNPLFMVNVVEHLVRQGLVREEEGRWGLRVGIEEVEVGVPKSLQQLIEKQLDVLSAEERRVLEVASVAGVEFSAAAVAAGLEAEVMEVEERCERLVWRNQFLQSRGTEERPDGTVAAGYSFLHALYQEVLYDQVTAGRRAQLHQRIGQQQEAAYGSRAGEIATELALHFERGRDYPRAVQYLGRAGQNAMRRHAYQEAIAHLSQGLELLKLLPDTAERTQQELMLQVALGVPLLMTKGYAAPEVEKTYARARELCQHSGQTPQLFPVLHGLWVYYEVRAELQTARELGEQFFALAQREQDPTLLLQAHHVLGETQFLLGELVSAREHLEQALALYDPQQHYSLGFLYGIDPGVVSLCYLAWTLELLGYMEQALKKIHQALTLAREVSLPLSHVLALNSAAVVYQFVREGRATQEQAEAAMALSTEHGFPLLRARGVILRGWALTEQGQGEEGIAQMRQGLAACLATGAEAGRRYFLALLAEAHGKMGQVEEGLAVLDEALAVVDKEECRNYEAELYRLKGELLLAQQNKRQRAKGKSEKVSEAEECFRQAITIARRQSAKSLELRAAISLSRLWQKQGKRKEARKMLAEIYNWFTEGFDTADLREARALLDSLSSKNST